MLFSMLLIIIVLSLATVVQFVMHACGVCASVLYTKEACNMRVHQSKDAVSTRTPERIQIRWPFTPGGSIAGIWYQTIQLDGIHGSARVANPFALLFTLRPMQPFPRWRHNDFPLEQVSVSYSEAQQFAKKTV